jgi:hypothetical protein
MWFKKHLNWTYVFAILIAHIIYAVLIFVVLRILLSLDMYELFYGSIYIAGALMMAAVWGVGAWVISQKKRSLFNLLWLLLGIIGIIIILCLHSQNDLKSRGAIKMDEIG